MKGSRRIGYYQLTEKNDCLEITKIFLSRTYQKRGIGRYLMESFEMLGYRDLILQVWENNPAYHFYKQLGYRKIKKKNHKIHMEKIL